MQGELRLERALPLAGEPLLAELSQLELAVLDAAPLLGLAVAGPAARLAKRALDVVVSLTALLLAAPLMLVCALVIRSTSGGPVLYVQDRVGRNGQTFRFLKFRSMRVDAERRRDDYLAANEATGPVFKIRRDPRITPFGRFLRKTSIDELPQLLNVLRGEMSLVGPRPPLPQEYAQYSERERRRLLVTPGLTCIWQVSGRSNIGFNQWVDMDLDYIDSWTFWRDVSLLVRTVPAVLLGRGAF